MHTAGLLKVEEAKKNGKWNQSDELQRKADSIRLDSGLFIMIQSNPQAYKNFELMTASRRRLLIFYIMSAKKEETKIRRTEKMIRL